MLWFDGPIRNAVDKVKSSGLTLIVFIRGKDELSKEYENFLNENSGLGDEDCVPIKIDHASVAFQQFKEIYFSVPIPSLFFIKNGGIPKAVVSSKKISDIRVAFNDIFGRKNCAIKNKSSIGLQKEPENRDNEAVRNRQCDKGSASKSSYAKNIGCKLLDISEDEIKKRLIEIRGFPRFLLIDNKSPEPDPHSQRLVRVHSARIQFRLPNNDMPSWEFPVLSTLADVRAYLTEKVNLTTNFKLMRAYSRTGFTPEDDNKTLIDLSLTPTSTLIVIPVQDKTVQTRLKTAIAQQNIVSLVFQTFMHPFLILFNYFKKHILKIDDDTNIVRPTRLQSETAIEKNLNKKTSTSNFQGFKFYEDTAQGNGNE
ncbi:hypothetical protein RUM43_011995 [Polyplax serrata]|uniref:UBX domain-containing protein 4 n=1 Tax=Polyplax serrata TaxID=468196 RepID=A0AAN8PU78_POLSC